MAYKLTPEERAARRAHKRFHFRAQLFKRYKLMLSDDEMDALLQRIIHNPADPDIVTVLWLSKYHNWKKIRIKGQWVYAVYTKGLGLTTCYTPEMFADRYGKHRL